MKIEKAKKWLGKNWVLHPEYQFTERHSPNVERWFKHRTLQKGSHVENPTCIGTIAARVCERHGTPETPHTSHARDCMSSTEEREISVHNTIPEQSVVRVHVEYLRTSNPKTPSYHELELEELAYEERWKKKWRQCHPDEGGV